MSKKITVASADDMDSETFAKHFTLRHPAHLGGSAFLPGDMSESMLKLHKVFHRKIHQLEVNLDHEHEGK